MMVRFLLILLLANGAAAQTVVVTNPLRAQQIVTAEALGVIEPATAGAFTDPQDVIGLETKVNLYPGRPVRFSDVGPPAVIKRNQIVAMIYRYGALSISTDGRALDRAGVGERVRVMNLDSRLTVTGTVLPDGSVEVGP